MTNATDKGVTLAQVIGEKFGRFLRGDKSPDPASTSDPITKALPGDVYNPLKFNLGGFVRIDTPELMKYTFSLESVSEFTRQIGTRQLKSTDYSLHDPEVPGEEGLWRTIRVRQNKDKLECYVLTPTFESELTEDIHHTLTGKVLTDNDSGVKYEKAGENEALVREFTKEGEKRLKLRYWDFFNEEGATPRLYMVEEDLTDKKGWIQAYLGVPISHHDVKPIAGHASR